MSEIDTTFDLGWSIKEKKEDLKINGASYTYKILRKFFI